MRTIKTIVLLLVLTAPILGTWAWLTIHKSQVRKAAKHYIMETADPSNFVTFQFTDEQIARELDWEHSREFEYKGQMYDVVDRYRNGDKTTIICWPDNEETVINKSLDNLVSQFLGNDPVNSESQEKVVVFYRSLYFEEITQYNFYRFPERRRKKVRLDETENPQFITPPTPPPKA